MQRLQRIISIEGGRQHYRCRKGVGILLVMNRRLGYTRTVRYCSYGDANPPRLTFTHLQTIDKTFMDDRSRETYAIE